jgi:hypothetical protein
MALRAGDVCLFNCIEVLREQLQNWQDQAEAAAATELAAAVADHLILDDGTGSNKGSGDEELDEELQQLPESSGRVGALCWGQHQHLYLHEFLTWKPTPSHGLQSFQTMNQLMMTTHCLIRNICSDD